MGGVFFFFSTLFRALFLVLTGASIMVITVTRVVEANQRPLNPFANYFDILLRRYEGDIEASGFTCHLSRVSSRYISRCLSGEMSEINRPRSTWQVEFSPASDEMTHVIFTLHEKLTLGHLTLLWGKPEINIVGGVAFFNWRHHITASAQPHNGRISYWLPIIDVTFASTR